MRDDASAERGDRLVALIGAFKIAKAGLLVAVGAGALLGVPDAVVGAILGVLQWIGALGHHAVHNAVNRALFADEHELHEVAVASLAYAAVFLVEGVGLLRRRRWAEWLTVFVTASFIPFEIYELARHPGAGKIVALALNVAIVVYLAWRRLKGRRRSPAAGLQPA